MVERFDSPIAVYGKLSADGMNADYRIVTASPSFPADALLVLEGPIRSAFPAPLHHWAFGFWPCPNGGGLATWFDYGACDYFGRPTLRMTAAWQSTTTQTALAHGWTDLTAFVQTRASNQDVALALPHMSPHWTGEYDRLVRRLGRAARLLVYVDPFPSVSRRHWDLVIRGLSP